MVPLTCDCDGASIWSGPTRWPWWLTAIAPWLAWRSSSHRGKSSGKHGENASIQRGFQRNFSHRPYHECRRILVGFTNGTVTGSVISCFTFSIYEQTVVSNEVHSSKWFLDPGQLLSDLLSETCGTRCWDIISVTDLRMLWGWKYCTSNTWVRNVHHNSLSEYRGTIHE